MNHPNEQGPPKALLAALPYVTDFTFAIDGGAYLGAWSELLASKFRHIAAFEIHYPTYRQLVANMARYPNVRCYFIPLIDTGRMVEAVIPEQPDRAFATYVVPDPKGNLAAMSIDGFLEDEDLSCGLIKLDLNGGDTLALYGASKTIEQDHPVIVVEEKGLGPVRAGTPVDGTHTFLTELGYEIKASIRPDVVYVWQN